MICATCVLVHHVLHSFGELLLALRAPVDRDIHVAFAVACHCICEWTICTLQGPCKTSEDLATETSPESCRHTFVLGIFNWRTEVASGKQCSIILTLQQLIHDCNGTLSRHLPLAIGEP